MTPNAQISGGTPSAESDSQWYGERKGSRLMSAAKNSVHPLVRARIVPGSGGKPRREEWTYKKEWEEYVLLYRATWRDGTWGEWEYATVRGSTYCVIFNDERKARRAVMRRCPNAEVDAPSGATAERR
jgi:hypothetical protein